MGFGTESNAMTGTVSPATAIPTDSKSEHNNADFILSPKFLFFIFFNFRFRIACDK